MDKQDKYGSQFGGVGCAKTDTRDKRVQYRSREEESTAAGCYQILIVFDGEDKPMTEITN
jgi:hypothetical protein